MDNAESRVNLALALIEQMGGFDGSDHKQYCLDQVVRALCGGRLDNAYAAVKTPEYEDWVKEYCDGEDGPETYEWDEGIAP